MIKKHFGNKALRLGGDFIHFKLGVEEKKHHPIREDLTITGNSMRGELRAGVEKEFRFRKFRPFAATDLLLSYGYTRKNEIFTGIHPSIYDFTEKRGFIGVAPTIGLKYQICNLISLTIETSLSILYYEERSTILDPRTRASKDYKNGGPEAYFNPLRLISLNCHFN